MMDPHLKTKWIAALRGGDYVQTTGHLKHQDRAEFCCLGVLCDIQGPIEWLLAAPKSTLLTPNGITLNSFRDDFMPHEFAAGINEDEQTALVNMNDAGTTFKQIADWIEESL